MKYLIGIDEAGRGPLAGPVAVGAVIVPSDFDWSVVAGVRDSKKLTPLQREVWYKRISMLKNSGHLNYFVSFSSAATIDKRGIVCAIHFALVRSLKHLGAKPDRCEVRLDGSLRAPEEFVRQRTIIHGDDIEPVISMASIMAKVSRDRLLQRLALRFPEYDLQKHKGYGTRAHREAILHQGLSGIHRRSFCRGLLVSQKTV